MTARWKRSQASSTTAVAGGNMPGARLARAVTATFVLLLVCGSLTPFDFDIVGAWQGARLGHIGWPSSSSADILTNIVVYAPLGAALYACFVRRGALPAFLLALGAAACLSTSIELAQTAIRDRFASWVDVAVNALGASGGALLAATVLPDAAELGRKIRRRLRERPFAVVPAFVTASVFAYAVIPPVAVRSTAELQAMFRHAHLPVMAASLAGRLVSAAPEEAPLSCLGLAHHDWMLTLLFVALGYTGVMAGREDRRRHWATLTETVGAAFLLAVVVETVQLFSRAHTYELTSMLANGAAAAIGALTADRVAASQERRPSTARPATVALVPGVLLAAFWLLQASLVVGLVGARAAGGIGWRINWVPFAEYFRLPLATAAAILLQRSVLFATFALTTVLLSRRAFGARQYAPAVLLFLIPVAAAAACGGIGGLPGASVSDPILAVLALGLAMSVHAWITGESAPS